NAHHSSGPSLLMTCGSQSRLLVAARSFGTRCPADMAGRNPKLKTNAITENLAHAFTTRNYSLPPPTQIMSGFMPTQTLSSPLELQVSPHPSKHKLFIFLIVLVWAIVYIGTLFQPALQDDADTVHAEAAREMVTGHDWVTLRINGGDGATGF